MMPLISVIIPVYNVEKYLRECLDSVINQTYKNLEIICVNDCSTDSSPEILEEYAKKDRRIIIKKNPKNIGLGLTRNEGIKIASGEYIHCLDSDDWLELDAYEIFVKYLDNDVDAVRFTYTSHDEITEKKEYIGYCITDFLYKKINIYNAPECFKMWKSSAWIKIYKKDFILKNNLWYNDYRCLEDIEYAMRSALAAKNIIFIKENLLNYRANRNGSLLTKRAHYIDNVIKDTKWANSLDIDKEVKAEILDYIYELLVMNCLDAYYVNVLKYKQMRKIFKENIDMDVFSVPLARKLTEKVLSYSSFKFFLSYCARRFIREHFPELTKKYFAIKKKLLQTN
ncbi:TPA: hypothetical protein CPT90_00715 [Candidatus Gastranaerophilales bacterium HUM_3]|jgi:glycosyl transferase GT2 family|nr:MAG TPA: hypothetical protein CPT90_00715 [Candidatus Gastranaerophilales bacterium HUM_3]